ncbi:hypothetical protein J2T07_002884 [Luteibacter jiangsuensis]|uniref:Uncharacterized protein n=1 Tax=Luteibacter jiangsuensis TaxID=637577 RepID=A0ABT9T089_9GAMM|nr:hypothetical protein [Luteibacter jiangsuensis]MDQ0010678.1 hypothetical protein [Luteibacter jiangsuensis]
MAAVRSMVEAFEIGSAKPMPTAATPYISATDPERTHAPTRYLAKREGVVLYRRTAIFSSLVLLAMLVPGVVLAAMLGWKPLLFGHNPEQAGANFRLIELVLTGLASSLVYVWFLWPVTKRLVVHTLIVFLVVEAIQSLAGLVFGDSVADAFVWQAFLVDALYAAIGLSLVSGSRFVNGMKVA